MNAVDLFAGAGGWSHGWRMATGSEPLLAVNHCAHAIHLHTLNHPGTEHLPRDVWEVLPQFALRGRRVDWLHGSPDCTHFSRAKGGKPREQKIRALAWVVVEWAKAARPRFLSLENVGEFLTWGPLDAEGHPIKERAGETFAEFLAALRRLGYAVEWRVLCAADYGAPTIRKRLFLLARNDGLPIRWPEPTHGAGRPLPWRTAAECIDWSIPCPSIFARKRPLAPATCRRIAAGVVRYVLERRPFTAWATMDGGDRSAHVFAFLAKHYGGVVGSDLRAPLGTVTSTDHHSLVTVRFGAEREALKRGRLAAAFITSYYGAGGTASSLSAPLPTVVTHDRHGLVTVALDGLEHRICDIGLRMLQPRELARAQGFPDSYRLEGSKAEQIARVGNSVVPQIAEALVRANIGAKAAVA